MTDYDVGPRDARPLTAQSSQPAAPPTPSTRALFVGSLLTLAVPLLLVPIPPILDYPNHLVRLWLISGGAATPPLSEIYAVSWDNAHTNVGIDYLGALLGRIVPVVPLGALFMLLALVLPPLGAAALNRSIFGGVHWSQIALVFFAWNATLIAGFLNFQIGIGLALLGASLEPRLARLDAAPRSGARLAIGLALLIVHVFSSPAPPSGAPSMALPNGAN